MRVKEITYLISVQVGTLSSSTSWRSWPNYRECWYFIDIIMKIRLSSTYFLPVKDLQQIKPGKANEAIQYNSVEVVVEKQNDIITKSSHKLKPYPLKTEYQSKLVSPAHRSMTQINVEGRRYIAI